MVVRWLSRVPESCDICRVKLEDEFFDARTLMGKWGCLCRDCWTTFGIGLGVGKGQKFVKMTPDVWLKEEG